MRATAAALILSAGLGACATHPEPNRPISDAAVYDGGVAVGIVGTPFYALTKVVSCVATLLIAAPSSTAVAMTDRSRGVGERLALQRGVADNCAGPYYLAPVSPAAAAPYESVPPPVAVPHRPTHRPTPLVPEGTIG
jgi:hypothetical protein